MVLNPKFLCVCKQKSVNASSYTQAMWYSNQKFVHLSTGLHSSSVHGTPDVEPEPVIHPISNTIAYRDKSVILLMGTCELERSLSSAQYRPISSSMLCGPEGKVWKLTGSPLHRRSHQNHHSFFRSVATWCRAYQTWMP
jgi:hypothetical protein